MTFTNILYEVLDEVAVLTFNRPEVSNGFNIPMCQEILEAISLAASDSVLLMRMISNPW